MCAPLSELIGVRFLCQSVERSQGVVNVVAFFCVVGSGLSEVHGAAHLVSWTDWQIGVIESGATHCVVSSLRPDSDHLLPSILTAGGGPRLIRKIEQPTTLEHPGI
jgi:hypothetical protein